MSDGLRILHATLPEDWERAQRDGSYAMSTRGRSLAQEGFIHASTTAQASVVLDTFYADVPAVVLLVLDIDELTGTGSPIRWDEVPGAAGPFPHIYGPIPAPHAGQRDWPGSNISVVAPDVARVVTPVVAQLRVPHVPGEPWRLPDLTSCRVATGP